jgi:hypothetical protein
MEIIERAAASIEEVSKHDLRLLGIALYWAEGRKRGGRVVDFSNSDPITIKIMMRFFREICNVPETKFRCHIHTYSHSNAGTAEKYWSTITAIPLTQFYKTYSKPSKASLGKRDSLPHGTLDVYICDTKLFLTIVGWIKKVSWLLVEG